MIYLEMITAVFYVSGAQEFFISPCQVATAVISSQYLLCVCVFKLRLTDRGFREFAHGFCL